MSAGLTASARRVQEALHAAGVELAVVELPASTRSAAEAADAVGCRLEQIAKSIVFRRGDTDEAVLVVASGPNRIDEKRVGESLGCELTLAKPEFVRRTRFGLLPAPRTPYSSLLPRTSSASPPAA